MTNPTHFLWVEKYRPDKVDDIVLPESIKSQLRTFIDQKNIPNIILSGPPGAGKTTAAIAMCKELDAQWLKVNGSLSGNIDTLRHDIQRFASTISLKGGRKYVIIDEGDGLNPQSFQPALRAFLEDFSDNCGFIITCNNLNKIIEPLQSRCSVIDFTMDKKTISSMSKVIFKATLDILTKEGVDFDKKAVANVIKRYSPDWRKCIGELQKYASGVDKLTEEVTSRSSDTTIAELIDHMRTKNFNEIRAWVALNGDIETGYFYRMLLVELNKVLKSHTVPNLVVILADYQYKAAFAADLEINTTACLVEILSECEFK